MADSIQLFNLSTPSLLHILWKCNSWGSSRYRPRSSMAQTANSTYLIMWTQHEMWTQDVAKWFQQFFSKQKIFRCDVVSHMSSFHHYFSTKILKFWPELKYHYKYCKISYSIPLKIVCEIPLLYEFVSMIYTHLSLMMPMRVVLNTGYENSSGLSQSNCQNQLWFFQNL